MRIAVSNVAWNPGEDDKAARCLIDGGATGVEIAPTKVWKDPASVTAEQAMEYRMRWEARGLPIVAMQSLLFGRADLQIFADADTRAETGRYIRSALALGARLGASALVFGSPKNRRVGAMGRRRAEGIARVFFRDLGLCAEEHGIALCIEPNAPEYGCDFLTTVGETVAFVDDVDTAGLALHLDAGVMTLVGDDPIATIPLAAHRLRHFHASEPFLRPVGTGAVDHARFAKALACAGYAGNVSIEMLTTNAESADRERANALRVVTGTYGTA